MLLVNRCACVQFYLEPRDRIKQLQEKNGAKDRDGSRRGFFTSNIGQSVPLTGWPSNNSCPFSLSQ